MKKKTLKTLNEKVWFRLVKVLHLFFLSIVVILGFFLIISNFWQVEERYFLQENVDIICRGGNGRRISGYTVNLDNAAKEGISKYEVESAQDSKYKFDNLTGNYTLRFYGKTAPTIARSIVAACQDPAGIKKIEQNNPKYLIEEKITSYEDFRAYFYRMFAELLLNEQNSPTKRIGVVFKENGKDFTIGDIEPGSPAEKAGLKKGDVLELVNNKVYPSLEDVVEYIKKSKAPFNLTIKRNGEFKSFKIEAEKIDINNYAKSIIENYNNIILLDEEEAQFQTQFKKELEVLIKDHSNNLPKIIVERAININGINENYFFDQEQFYKLKPFGFWTSLEDILKYTLSLLFCVIAFNAIVTSVFYYIYFGKTNPPQK